MAKRKARSGGKKAKTSRKPPIERRRARARPSVRAKAPKRKGTGKAARKPARRKKVVIFGVIVVGGSAHDPAVALDKFEVFGFADVFGALKYHVFEQMSETRPTFHFVARANVVEDSDGYNRNRVLLG